jgi:hypothetical protein
VLSAQRSRFDLWPSGAGGGELEVKHSTRLFLRRRWEAQGKLLRALQQNEIIRVGGGADDEMIAIQNGECESLQESFHRWLLVAIEICDGNLTTVAKKHGLSRSTLYRKVKELDIDVNSFRTKRAAAKERRAVNG